MIPFPAVMARPSIMDRTEEAMALRVFDELAIFPERKTKRDPIIVGRIRRPGKSAWALDSFLHFMIAWLVIEADI